ncbi:hypothetical protein JXL21_04330 [Candidatus Bathyarchaeota archaeon]|nr:hypothetical protein [Candidatus Bathyarchaeota archaeon]
MDADKVEDTGETSKKSVADYRGNERLYLTVTDFLMIAMILVDLLYWGGYLEIGNGNIMAANVIIVALSYVGYEMKKRIRRRTIRRKKKEG